MNDTKTRWLDVAGTLARLVLAGVLGAAALAKVTDPVASVTAVRAYELLPEGLERPVGYGLPFLELGLAVLLLVGLATRLAAVLSGLLMVAFVVGITSAWARGLSIDCGCFGGGGTVAPGDADYVLPLLRDAGLVLVAGYLAWRPRSLLALDGRPAPARPDAEDPDDEGPYEPDRGDQTISADATGTMTRPTTGRVGVDQREDQGRGES